MGCCSQERTVNAVVIEAGLESLKFSFEIASVPKWHEIEKFPSSGSNQSFYEWMREGAATVSR
jgi:hypothetical protein